MSHPSPKVDLADLFDRHKRVHIAFSGGRDSIVLADLCRPWRDQVTLVWANTGIMWPHMVQFVRDYGHRFRLLEVTAKQDAITHWRQTGLPADVMLSENACGFAQPLVQPWHCCCFALRWAPITEAVAADGATAFLHGQRANDGPLFSDHQALAAQLGNVEVGGPIWNWSPDDVQRHIEQNRLDLPHHYQHCASSLECAICPAHESRGERQLRAQLSPALARASEAIGGQLRHGAVTALMSILREAPTVNEDRPARWKAVAPLIASALEYDTAGKTIEDIQGGYLAGQYELLTTEQSALLVEFIEHDGQAIVHLYLGGGALRELTDILVPEAEMLGKLRDCRYSVVGGRRGWSRALKRHGYSYLGRSALPHSWVAIKLLKVTTPN